MDSGSTHRSACCPYRPRLEQAPALESSLSGQALIHENLHHHATILRHALLSFVRGGSVGRAHGCRREHSEQWNVALLLQISDNGGGALITQLLVVSSVPRRIRVARHLDHVGIDLLGL